MISGYWYVIFVTVSREKFSSPGADTMSPLSPTRLFLGLAVYFTGITGLPCGCRRPVPGVDVPPTENRLRRGHAPTPFSAEEIRRGCRPGTYRKYLIETPGREKTYRIIRFESDGAENVEVFSVMTDLQGRVFGEQRRLRARWKALQSHASFPESQTDIRPERFKSLAGVHDCWRYEVRSRVDGKPEIRRFWFAKKLPGPPVCFERRVEGKLVLRMVLVSAGRGTPRLRPAHPSRPSRPAHPARPTPVRGSSGPPTP